MRYYKYYKIDDYPLLNLSNNQFYFNSVDNVNDPFEFSVRFDISDDYKARMLYHIRNDKVSLMKQLNIVGKNSEEIYQDMEDQAIRSYQDNLENHFRQEMFKKAGITCFTDNYRSIQMWGHYADSFKGICVEYELSDEFTEDMFKVRYADEPRTLKLSPENIKNPPDIEHFRDVLLTKHKDWCYENEYRLLGESGTVREHNSSCIKSIFFGSKCDPVKMVKVYHAIENRENIIFYMMLESNNSYSMKFHRIKEIELDGKKMILNNA